MKPNPTSFRHGVTLVEVLAIIAVILVLAAVLVPTLTYAKRKSRLVRCFDNIKQLQLGFRMWTLPSGDKYPMQNSINEGGSMEFVGAGETFAHFRAISNEVRNAKLLLCPDDLTRTAAMNFQTDLDDSKVSYFVSMDAGDDYPAGLFVGDSHLAVDGAPVKPGLLLLKARANVSWTLARHRGEGNVGLADGSVHQTTASLLQKLMIDSEIATKITTNRLSIP